MGRSTRQNPSPNPPRSLPTPRKSSRKASSTTAAAPKPKPAPKPASKPKKATASKVADANVAIPSIEPAAPPQIGSTTSQAPTHGRVTRAATRSQTKSRSPFSPDNLLKFGKSILDKVAGRPNTAAKKAAPKPRSKLTKTKKAPVEDADIDELEPSLRENPQNPQAYIRHKKHELAVDQDSDDEEPRPSKRPRIERDESDSIPTTEQEAISPSHIPNPRAPEIGADEQHTQEPQAYEPEVEEQQIQESQAYESHTDESEVEEQDVHEPQTGEPEAEEQQAHEPPADAPLPATPKTITTQEVIADIANNPLPADKLERKAEMERRFNGKMLNVSIRPHNSPSWLKKSHDATRRWLHSEGAHQSCIDEFEEVAAQQMSAALAEDARQSEIEYQANRSMTSEELNAPPLINLSERLTHVPLGLTKTESLRLALSMPQTPEKKATARKMGDRTMRRANREKNKDREVAKKQSTISKSMTRSLPHSPTPTSRVTSSAPQGIPELMHSGFPQAAEEVTSLFSEAPEASASRIPHPPGVSASYTSDVSEVAFSSLPEVSEVASSHLLGISEVASSHFPEVSEAAISRFSEFISVNLPNVSWRFSRLELAEILSSFPHLVLTHVNHADTMRLFIAYLSRHDRLPSMWSATSALQFYFDMSRQQVIENLSHIEDDVPELIMVDPLYTPRDRAQQITKDTGENLSESEFNIFDEEVIDEKMGMDSISTPQTPSRVWSALPNWGTVSKIKNVLLSPAKYFGLGGQSGDASIASSSTFTFRQPSGIADSREPETSPTPTQIRRLSQKRNLPVTPSKKLPRQSSKSPRKSAKARKTPVPIHMQGVFMTKEDEIAARQRLKAKQERKAALSAREEQACQTARQETATRKRNAYAAAAEEAEDEESENPHNITLSVAGQQVGEKRKRTPAPSGCFRAPSPSDGSLEDGDNAEVNDNDVLTLSSPPIDERRYRVPFEKRKVRDEDGRLYRVDTPTNPYAEHMKITKYTPPIDPYNPNTKVHVKAYYAYVNNPPKAKASSIANAQKHFGDYWRQIYEIQNGMSNMERYWDNYFRVSSMYTIWDWLLRHELTVDDPTCRKDWLLSEYYDMMLLREKKCCNRSFSAPEPLEDEDEEAAAEETAVEEKEVAKEVTEDATEEKAVAKEVTQEATREKDAVPLPPAAPTPQHAMLPQQAPQQQQTPLSQIAGNASNKYQPAIPSKLRNMTVMSPIHQTGIKNTPLSVSIYSKYLSASTEPFQGFSKEVEEAVLNAPKADLDRFFL